PSISMSSTNLHTPPRSTLFPYTTLFRSRDRTHDRTWLNHQRREPVETLHDLRKLAQDGLQFFDAHVKCGGVFKRQPGGRSFALRSEEHTSELQSRGHLVCRLLLEKKKKK